jgi:hypothetical protein
MYPTVFCPAAAGDPYSQRGQAIQGAVGEKSESTKVEVVRRRGDEGRK